MDCVTRVRLPLLSLRFCWKRLCVVALLGLVLNLGWLPVAQAQVPTQVQAPEDLRITPLIEKLTDRSPQMRLDAADALVAIGSPALPALTMALQSPDPSLRWHAASVLEL